MSPKSLGSTAEEIAVPCAPKCTAPSSHTRAPEGGPSLSELVVALGAIASIWSLAAIRWIVTDTVVPWDSKNQSYAFFRFLAASISSGVSPFWNPYHFGGHPSVADPQSLIFSPAFVAWSLLDSAPSLHTFDLIVFAHLLVGGLAVGAIGWRAHWPAAASVLAAAAFMLGGVAAGRLQHTSMILSYAVFPPALLLLELALDRRSLGLASAFSFLAALLVLGRNQVALLLCILLTALLIDHVARTDRPFDYLRARVPIFITIAAIGFVLIAAPMLLTMQFAALSNRPEAALEVALKSSLHPGSLAQLAVANIYNSHGEFWGPGPSTVPEIPYIDESFSYLFVGWVPMVLVLWFGVAGGWAFRRSVVLLSITLLLALLYAFGRYTPFFTWAFDIVPEVSKFRRPIDASFVFMAAFALLVGQLLSDYVRQGLPRWRLLIKGVVATCAVAMIAWAILFSGRTGHAGEAFIELLKSIPVLLLTIALLIFGQRLRNRAAIALFLMMVGVAELLWWNVAFRLNAEARVVYDVLEKPISANAEVIATLESVLREHHAAGERPRVEVVGMGGPWQNAAMVHGFEATNGYNPLRIGAYDRLVSPGEGNWVLFLREFPRSFADYDSPLGQALGLEFLVLGNEIEKMPYLPRRPDADTVLAGPKAWVYRLRHPSPRTKFSNRIRIADSTATDDTGRLLATPSPDDVLIDIHTLPQMNYGDRGGSAGTARISAWRPDRVEIEVNAEQNGILTLHDVYYPGWVAEIDGRAAPILRADVLFRAVEVPAGPHKVVFRYVPFSLENLINALKLALD